MPFGIRSGLSLSAMSLRRGLKTHAVFLSCRPVIEARIYKVPLHNKPPAWMLSNQNFVSRK